jgi:hypothetical protein
MRGTFRWAPETAIEGGGASGDVAGDLAPEGILFINEGDSPADDVSSAVGFEVSDTTGPFGVGTDPPGEN